MSKIDQHKYIPELTADRCAVNINRYTPNMLSSRAAFAMLLLEKSSFVDTPRNSPDEMVQRACDIAQKAFEEFEKREWYDHVGEYDELIDKAYANNARRQGSRRARKSDSED